MPKILLKVLFGEDRKETQMSSDATETKPCSNCKKDIAAANFTIHEVHCKRRLVLCTICSVPVLRSGETQHVNDVHAKTPCAQCQEEVERDHMTGHLKDTCPKRPVQCDYCDSKLPQCQLAAHVEVCGTRVLSCPRCNNVITHKDLAKHQASSCAHPEGKPRQPVASTDVLSNAECKEMQTTGEEAIDVSMNPDEVLDVSMFIADRPASQERSSCLTHDDVCDSDAVLIPCEFCTEIFPACSLALHQDVCDFNIGKPTAGELSEPNQAQAQTGPSGTRAFPASTPLSPGNTLLPCELCEELVPADFLLRHQTEAHIDTHLTNLLPCEFCEVLLPASSLIDHQATCGASMPVRMSTSAEWHIPENWVPHEMNENVKKVPLASSDPEYINVAESCKRTFNAYGLTIIEIARIQNHALHVQYLAKKTQLQKQNPGLENERILWHGTAPGAIENINNYGFNRSYCGKNGIAYGDGVYFAVDSSYPLSRLYSPPDSAGRRYLYLCNVLVGHSCQGTRGMKVLPARKPPVLYDSATNSFTRPAMYVIFNDTQAYPSYLITFTGGCYSSPPAASLLPSSSSLGGLYVPDL